MNGHDPLFFLFPYTAVSEADCIPLSILFPSLNLLRISRPGTLPKSCEDLVKDWSALEDEGQAAEIWAQLRHYKDFASLHGEAGLQSSMAQHWASTLLDENSRQIRSSLKSGTLNLEQQERKRFLMEAALFLELARDLDEKEMDLQEDYLKVGDLDENFRKILGMDEDDGLVEMVETLNLSLQNEKSHRSFLLPQRISFWLRLVLPRLGNVPAALVTGEREVIDTMADTAATVCSQRGEELDLEEVTLPPLPLNASLLEKNGELMAAARDLPQVTEFWSSTEEMVRKQGDEESWSVGVSRLQAAWKSLTDLWAPHRVEQASCVFNVSIVRFKNFSAKDLWCYWDKRGCQVLGDPGSTEPFRPLFFLYNVQRT